MNKEIFKLYDIRGEYPSQINEKEVFEIGFKSTSIFRKGAKIVIGRDARLSSPGLSKALENGLINAGFEVFDVGIITTPMLDFAVNFFKADGGIVVTASHNPKDDNGLGIVDSSGLFIGGRDLFLKMSSEKNNFKTTYIKKENKIKRENLDLKYAQELSEYFDVSKKIKAVVDCSNGSSAPVIKKIKFPKNVEAIIINGNLDGNFKAHGPDPTQKIAQVAIAKAVIKYKADIGIVFDGDGDRALFADGKGKIIRPENIWRILAQGARDKKQSVVFTVLCRYMMNLIKNSSGFSNEFNFVETRVGHLFMKEVCRKEKAFAGVESSMRYYFPEDNFSGSAILAMIKVINSISKLPYDFYQLSDMLPKVFVSREINFKFDLKKLPVIYSKIKKMFSSRDNKIYFTDGISVLSSDWWFNVRPSNTENLVRLNIEAKEEIKLEEIKKYLTKILSK